MPLLTPNVCKCFDRTITTWHWGPRCCWFAPNSRIAVVCWHLLLECNKMFPPVNQCCHGNACCWWPWRQIYMGGRSCCYLWLFVFCAWTVYWAWICLVANFVGVATVLSAHVWMPLILQWTANVNGPILTLCCGQWSQYSR